MEVAAYALLGVPRALLMSRTNRLPVFQPQGRCTSQARAPENLKVRRHCQGLVVFVHLQFIQVPSSRGGVTKSLVFAARTFNDSVYANLLNSSLDLRRVSDHEVGIDEPAARFQKIEGLADHGLLVLAVEMMKCIRREDDIEGRKIGGSTFQVAEVIDSKVDPAGRISEPRFREVNHQPGSVNGKYPTVRKTGEELLAEIAGPHAEIECPERGRTNKGQNLQGHTNHLCPVRVHQLHVGVIGCNPLWKVIRFDALLIHCHSCIKFGYVQRLAVQRCGRRQAGAAILYDFTAATLTAATAVWAAVRPRTPPPPMDEWK